MNYTQTLIARAAHREIFAQPARYVRLAIIRGQKTLVQYDSNNDAYPVCWSKRAWRTVVYRTPVSREYGR